MEGGKDYSQGKVWAYCLTIAMGNFYCGYNISAFNASMDDIASALSWGSSKTLFTTLFTAAYPLGAIFTVLFVGRVMNALGRRKTMMWVAVAAIAVHCFNVIPNTWTFGVARVLAGVLGAFVTTVPPLFINEVSPTAIAGSAGTLVQTMICFGLVVPGLLALLLPTGDYSDSSRQDLWMLIFGFPVVFMTFQLLLFLCVAKYESPVWLIRKGRGEEAKAFYRYVYTQDAAEKQYEAAVSASRPLTQEMHTDVSQSSGGQSVFSFRSFFFSKQYRTMMHLSIMLQVLQQWSGLNAINSYSASMFGLGVFEGRVFSLVLFVVNLISVCITIPVVEKAGRRPLMLVGTLGCALSLAATGFSSLFDQPYVSIVFVIIYIFFYEISLGPVVWTLVGEILYDGAMGVSVITNWGNYFLLVLVFPFMVEGMGIYVCFWIFAGVTGAGVAYCWWYVFETKGRNKGENQKKVMGEG